MENKDLFCQALLKGYGDDPFFQPLLDDKSKDVNSTVPYHTVQLLDIYTISIQSFYAMPKHFIISSLFELKK